MKIHPFKSFGLRECPSCAVETERNQNRCPLCGYEFPHPPPARRRLFGLTALLLLTLFLLLALGVRL